MTKKKISQKKIKEILKWYFEVYIPWYDENYGGIQPMDEDDGKKKPPPPLPH
jgi:hypothetical protein